MSSFQIQMYSFFSLTGKVAKYRAIDVRDRVVALGPEKSGCLIGLHHFTGADLVGKFVGVSKKRHGFPPIFRYRLKMKLCKHLQTWAMTRMLPRLLSNLHCKMAVTFQRCIARLNDLSAMSTLSKVAWILYLLFGGSYSARRTLRVRSSLQLVEYYPTHIVWANYMTMRDKSYISVMSKLPPLEQNGWEVSSDEGYLPSVLTNQSL